MAQQTYLEHQYHIHCIQYIAVIAMPRCVLIRVRINAHNAYNHVKQVLQKCDFGVESIMSGGRADSRHFTVTDDKTFTLLLTAIICTMLLGI